ncbi:MAG: hypothetical protein IJZ83_08610 [Clostridia bacterium]|nr:hypothetical protein [Clostridia bacterium]
MKKYTQPNVEVIYMNSADLITASPITVNSTDLDCGYTSWGNLFGE